MKLPEPSENIYPRSKENIMAILEHYFPTTSDKLIEESLGQFLENKRLSLNQIEFGAKFILENEELLDEAEFSNLPSARIHYALMAIFSPRKDWRTSGNNTKRLEHFRQLYRDSFFKDWPE